MGTMTGNRVMLSVVLLVFLHICILIAVLRELWTDGD